MFRHPSLRSTTTTLAAAVVLVAGADLASYAATGQPLVLGHLNSAGQTTTLTNNGSGPALALTSGTNYASLKVSSSKVIKNLNADKLDGLTGTQLQNVAYVYSLPSTAVLTTQSAWSFPGLPAGRWLATYSVVAFTSSSLRCFFRETSPTTAQAFSYTTGPTGDMNATAVIDTTGSHGPVKFYCNGSSYSLYTAAADVASTITFTNLTSVVSNAVTASRTAATSREQVTGSR